MKTLKKFEFTSGADRSQYDWNKLLDGGIYQVTEGEDYQCKTQTFAMMARKQAENQGVSVKVNKIEGGLVLQAEPGATDESREQARAARKSAKAEENGVE